MNRQGSDRFKVVLMLAAICLICVEGKLVKLQIVEHEFWDLEAIKSRTSARSFPFERGWILDRNLNPLALTQSLFELRFVFRNYRLRSPAGHISMVYYIINGERCSVREIYENPLPYIEGVLGLTPDDVLSERDRWKRRDLITYLEWLLQLSSEEADLIFESHEYRSLSLCEIPHLAGAAQEIEMRVCEERAALRALEEELMMDEGAIFAVPDTEAQCADAIVDRRFATEMGDEGAKTYLKLRNYHRTVDSRERTVSRRNVGHSAAVRVVLGEELYPGFYIVESTRRAYPEKSRDVCPLLIGRTGYPHEGELEMLRSHFRRLEELSLIEDKTEEELIEEERLGIWVREIDVRPDEEVGRLGLEAILEPVLRGKRGYLLKELAPLHGESRVLEYAPPIRGRDVVLTLDQELQRVCEKALDDVGFGGSVVIMDVHSGAILAMATAPKPKRDALARNYSELSKDPAHPLMQRTIHNQNLPPPGSVFKLVTSIAALEEGLCGPGQEFECQKQMNVGRSLLRCLGHHGLIAMEDAIVRSCNIYYYNLGRNLGYEKLFKWARAFGFGNPTGFLNPELYGFEGSFTGFPEDAGALKEHETGLANLMRFAIGQGAIDDVTTLQVARMAAGIATGKLPQPYLISRIGDQPFAPPPPTDIGISKNTMDFLHGAMKNVIFDHRGTAGPNPSLELDLRPFRVAGKTGTPQVGGDRPTHASFAGYWPYDFPKYSFAVFVESCDQHGGDIAAPLLNRILESPAAEPFLPEKGS